MIESKECPVCKSTYSDDSLYYCLMDGSVLTNSNPKADFGSWGLPPMPETETVVLSKQKIHRIEVSLEKNRLYFDEDLSIQFKRTLRVPDDGKRYPLPAALGSFPIYKVADYSDKVPSHWNRHGGVFIPMYQREALFIDFNCEIYWKPKIVKIATGKINAISGEAFHQSILDGEQDYVVVPGQRWLDGFKTGRDIVRQFVAMPLGQGYTVESQLAGKESAGGIQFIVFDPNPGIFSPPEPTEYTGMLKSIAVPPEMGIGAGGRIEQKVYEDRYGSATWDVNHFGRVYVHIVNSLAFKEITGLDPPESPITADTYQKNGIPWFELYDEPLLDVTVSEKLYELKPIKLLDKIKGVFHQDDFTSLNISQGTIKKIAITPNIVEDGDWDD